MEDKSLIDESAEFAGKYIEQFGPKNEIAKTLILNAVAHGYYTGNMSNKNANKSMSFRLWNKFGKSNKWMLMDSVKASENYLNKRGGNMNANDKIVVKAAFCHGYINGFSNRGV